MFRNTKQLNIRLLIGLFSLVAIIRPSYAEVQKIAQRNEIDDKYKWNLEKIYPSLEDWERDFQYVKDNYLKIEEYQGHLAESADELYDCLKFKEKIDYYENLFSTKY